MAEIVPQGVRTRSLGEWRSHVEGLLRNALGSDLSLAPETVEGQIAGIMALAFAEQDEAFADLASAIGLSTAGGSHLESLASIVHLRRQGAASSRAGLVLTGVAGTRIPAGSLVRTSDGVNFATEETVLIAAGGTVEVSAASLEPGVVLAPAGTIRVIATLIAGWETATNPEDAVPGRDMEGDREFRSRYRLSTGRLANGPQDALEAALVEAGATAFRIVENDGAAGGIITGGSIPTVSFGTRIRFSLGGRDIDFTYEVGPNLAAQLQTALREAYPGATVELVPVGRLEIVIPDAADISLGIQPHSDGANSAAAFGFATQAIRAGYSRLQGFDIPPHSVVCVVRGGIDSEIAAAIRRAKSVGVATWAGSSGSVSIDVDGRPTVFRRPTETAIEISLAIEVGADFPSTGVQDMRQALLDYAAGEWRGGDGQFDTLGFEIGKALDERRLLSPVNSIPGHRVSTVSVAGAADPNLDTLFTLAGEDVTITVV